jgi:hypothetical protein
VTYARSVEIGEGIIKPNVGQKTTSSMSEQKRCSSGGNHVPEDQKMKHKSIAIVGTIDKDPDA